MVMELIALGAQAAAEHVPDKLTYVIRILSEHCDEKPRRPLIESPNYKVVKEYFFDDISPADMQAIKRSKRIPGAKSIDDIILFDEHIATAVIKDFQHYSHGCESLLVHCIRGLNRSPAIMMTLNEIFRLGGDAGELMAEYPDYSTYVAMMMIETAKKLQVGIYSPIQIRKNTVSSNVLEIDTQRKIRLDDS